MYSKNSKKFELVYATIMNKYLKKVKLWDLDVDSNLIDCLEVKFTDTYIDL